MKKPRWGAAMKRSFRNAAFFASIGVAVAMSMMAVAGAARAESQGICLRYAESAIAQQRDNLRLGCGRSGQAWHENYQSHLVWCRSQPPGIPQTQTAMRAGELSECQADRRGGGPRYGDRGDRPRNDDRGRDGDFCDAYARAAIADQAINVRRGCGFSGGRWHSSYPDHAAFCRSSSRGAVADEERARRSRLRNAC